jgi:hypothetical protein
MKILTARNDVGLLCLLAVLTAAPLERSRAATPQSSSGDKPVTLHMENVDIRSAVRLLFEAAGMSFTIAPDVQGTVTLSLKEVPFRVALRKLIEASGKPLVYRPEFGVYDIRTDTNSADAEKLRTVSLNVNFVNAADLVARFDGDLRDFPPKGVSIKAGPANSILVRYSNEDDLRELKELIRLFDRRTAEIEISAELVIQFGTLSPSRPPGVITATGRTISDKPIVLRMSDRSTRVAMDGLRLASGDNTLRVTPRRYGDGTIGMDASWELDLLWKPAHGGAPVHVRRSFTGALRSGGGSALKLTGSAIKLTGDNGGSTEGEISLYLTARLVPEAAAFPPTEVPGLAAYEGMRTVVLEVDDKDAGKSTSSIIAALARELTATQRYEVVPAETVAGASESLGLRRPYDAQARDRLMNALGAGMVVRAEIRRNPGGRGLRLVARTFETSGLMRTGAATVSETELEASARSAAYAVVQSLLRYQVLSGTVLSSTGAVGGTAVVNRGARDGLTMGTEFVSWREGMRAGRLTVIRIYPNHSLARITEGAALVRPEDRVETLIQGKGPEKEVH